MAGNISPLSDSSSVSTFSPVRDTPKAGISGVANKVGSALWNVGQRSLIDVAQKYLIPIETGYEIKGIKVGLNQLSWIPFVSVISGTVRAGLGSLSIVAATVEFVARLVFMAGAAVCGYGSTEVELNGEVKTLMQQQRSFLMNSIRLAIHGIANIQRGGIEAEWGLAGNILCLIYDQALQWRFQYPKEVQVKS